MNVSEAIQNRRAYRSLEPVNITTDLIRDLAYHAQLAPSCFNNQPARFIFVYDKEQLNRLKSVFSKGNEWCFTGSLVIVVFTKKEMDCIIKEREYYLFDTGMATAFLILRATELGLVAHPIAGYNSEKVREVLGIPDEFTVITLIIVGRHSEEISPLLSKKQIDWEKNRPPRLPLEKVAFINYYQKEKAE